MTFEANLIKQLDRINCLFKRGAKDTEEERVLIEKAAAKMLLISNSTSYGSGFLDHCAEEIVAFLGNTIKTVAFVPYAKIDCRAYSERAKRRFNALGYELISTHESTNPGHLIKGSEAVFVGGGNTFLLLRELYKNDLLGVIRTKVLVEKTPYIGTSAGSNVACPSIKTTNDMPIVEPPSLAALNLVPFNINPHYVDPDPNSTHMGENRLERIREFHEFNDPPVIGLREGSLLCVEGSAVILKGKTGAVVFKKGEEPHEVRAGERLDALLQPQSQH